MSKIKENYYIEASEESYQLLIDEGFKPEYINVKENGLSWKGCFVISTNNNRQEEMIGVRGNWEWTVGLRQDPKYTEIYLTYKEGKMVLYKIESKIKEL